jgi:hypothetical protein
MNDVLKGAIVFKIKQRRSLLNGNPLEQFFVDRIVVKGFKMGIRETRLTMQATRSFIGHHFYGTARAKARKKERKAGFPSAMKVFFYGKKVEGCLR